ncbi:MAG: hypothetical protein DRI81_03855 [Chloroflexi bacterium]|nr:MAG: hypothetical protein DRI81_03855 [Chloroflexota bacterium]
MAAGEETAVEAHFSPTGAISPRRFTWRGSTVAVEGIGRCWKEVGKRCFGVLAAGGRHFELRLDEKTLRWQVSSVLASRIVA